MSRTAVAVFTAIGLLGILLGSAAGAKIRVVAFSTALPREVLQ